MARVVRPGHVVRGGGPVEGVGADEAGEDRAACGERESQVALRVPAARRIVLPLCGFHLPLLFLAGQARSRRRVVAAVAVEGLSYSCWARLRIHAESQAPRTTLAAYFVHWNMSWIPRRRMSRSPTGAWATAAPSARIGTASSSSDERTLAQARVNHLRTVSRQAGWRDEAHVSEVIGASLLGLRIVGTRSWQARTIDPDSGYLCVAGHFLVGHHGDLGYTHTRALVVFSFAGVRGFALTPPAAPPNSFPVPTASIDRCLYVVDPASGLCGYRPLHGQTDRPTSHPRPGAAPLTHRHPRRRLSLSLLALSLLVRNRAHTASDDSRLCPRATLVTLGGAAMVQQYLPIERRTISVGPRRLEP